MAEQSRAKIFLSGLLFTVCISPFLILLSYLGKPELMYPVIGASAAIALAIRGRWELRSHWWFWITAIAIVGLHVSLILVIPWKAGWIPAPITTLAGIVDLVILFGIFGIVEKLMKKQIEDGDNQQTD